MPGMPMMPPGAAAGAADPRMMEILRTIGGGGGSGMPPGPGAANPAMQLAELLSGGDPQLGQMLFQQFQQMPPDALAAVMSDPNMIQMLMQRVGGAAGGGGGPMPSGMPPGPAGGMGM